MDVNNYYKLEDNQKIYLYPDKDYNGDIHYFTNADVHDINVKDLNGFEDGLTDKVRSIINKHDVNSGYFIIGNWLFFMFNNNKYRISFSLLSVERDYIGEIIELFRKNTNFSKIYYKYGRED